MSKSKSVRVSVSLPEFIHKKLEAIAEQETRTVSAMARVLIEEAIKSRE